MQLKKLYYMLYIYKLDKKKKTENADLIAPIKPKIPPKANSIKNILKKIKEEFLDLSIS